MAKEKKIRTLAELKKFYSGGDQEYWDTGIPQINNLWSSKGQGMPRGAYIEAYGEAGTGKSTLYLDIIANILRKYPTVKAAAMDVEQAINSSLKAGLGLDKFEAEGRFVHLTPFLFSEVEEATEALLSENFDIIMYDSLTMTVPDKRKDGSITDIMPGAKAMLQAVYLETFKAQFKRKNATLLIVNQTRTKISMTGITLVVPAGGKAIEFTTDIRTSIKRTDFIKGSVNNEMVSIGAHLEVSTIKNKHTFPFRATALQLKFGEGVDPWASLVDMVLERGIVAQKGSYFVDPINSQTICRGKAELATYIEKNKEFFISKLGDVTTEIPEEEIKLTKEELDGGPVNQSLFAAP